MKLHASPIVPGDAVQYPALGEDFHIQPGLFLDLSHTSFLEVFSQVDAAARYAPGAHFWGLSPSDDEDVFVIEDDGSYADNRAKRIFTTQPLGSLVER